MKSVKNAPNFFFIFFGKFCLPSMMVLVSASVERCFVSRMPDFYIVNTRENCLKSNAGIIGNKLFIAKKKNFLFQQTKVSILLGFQSWQGCSTCTLQKKEAAVGRKLCFLLANRQDHYFKNQVIKHREYWDCFYHRWHN